MSDKRGGGLTRRDFLRGTGLGTLGWGLALAMGCAREGDGAPPQPEAKQAAQKRTKVVIARDRAALQPDGRADAGVVKALLEKALCELTGKGSLSEALGEFVRPTDRVGVKQNVMMTPVHKEVLYAIWEGLKDLGVPAENVITWDRRQGIRGYWGGKSVAIGFDGDGVATVCSQFADVLINVPGLKSHWLSGIGVCLKNWAGALSGLDVRDKNTRWPIHQRSCQDIGMIQAHPAIKSKARLCIVDALRPLCHGGPQVNPQYLWDYCGIVVGTDAVAVDRVCIEIIQQRRNELRGEPWPISPPPKHVAVAAEKYGLGVADLDSIEVVNV